MRIRTLYNSLVHFIVIFMKEILTSPKQSLDSLMYKIKDI